MPPMPETRNRRFLAIVLLLIVASLVYLIFFHWWFVSPQLDIAAQMADLRERQASFAQTSQQGPLIDKRIKEIRAAEQNNQAFLTDADAERGIFRSHAAPETDHRPARERRERAARS